MSREVEAKYRLPEPAALRAALRAAGAAPGPAVLETNTLFDTPDARLRHADRGLRLRTIAGGHATLTYKGPRQPATTAVKTRAEHETTIGDPAAAAALLSGLGFLPRVVFEKRRETWTLGPATITLDELPQLGWFAEIEAPAADDVLALAGRLGLTAAVAETYVELAACTGTPDATGAVHLRFAQP